MDEKGLAKYLAEEISKSGIMDLETLEMKIKTALVIMAPPVPNSQAKVGNMKAMQKSKNIKYSLEIGFWKEKARSLMNEEETQACYKQIDEILEDNGYEIKR